MNNPWLNISWDNRLADVDKNYQVSLKLSAEIQLDTLPEPFTGDVESNVYCLNLNPGGKDEFFESIDENKAKLLDYTQETLSHKINCNMWFELVDHNGYCWWRKVTSELRGILKRDPHMFVIEYFPYHSRQSFTFPQDLPSYEYSDELIHDAMKNGKFILIMRHKKEWIERIEKQIGQGVLQNYDKLFYLSNPRNPIISQTNIVKGVKCIYTVQDLFNHF